MISLAGPVVTLASFNTTVVAVYHSTDPGHSDQHFGMDIIALNGMLEFDNITLALWQWVTQQWSDVACFVNPNRDGSPHHFYISRVCFLPVRVREPRQRHSGGTTPPSHKLIKYSNLGAWN